MRPHIIGIHGAARAGKDTVADMALAMIGGYKYSCAGPIKAMVAAGFGIDPNDPYWIKHKEDVIPAFGKSLREMYQTLGTEWGRDLVHPDVWIILGKDKLLQNGPGMIIPDVRFQNEADWVREYGQLIFIRRKAAPGVAAHVSENGLEPLEGEVVIQNDGSLEDLRNIVRKILHVV